MYINKINYILDSTQGRPFVNLIVTGIRITQVIHTSKMFFFFSKSIDFLFPHVPQVEHWY